MIAKINRYLLTHFPLIWNTRVHWLLLTNFILYIIFFIVGYFSIRENTMSRFWNISAVGGDQLIIFSVLCSLLVLIVWLVFYLRNNAFKSFYRIGRFYMAKEFLLVLLIVFSSIIYFEAFNYGVSCHIRKIVPMERFTNEVNLVNNALAFIPVTKPPYFILNSCSERQKHGDKYDQVLPNEYFVDVVINKALNRPDAFSYRNYCTNFLDYSYRNIESGDNLSLKRLRWINKHNTDSISKEINDLLAICKKYNITYRLKSNELVNNVFADKYNRVIKWISTQQYDYSTDPDDKWFLNLYQVSETYSLINSAHDEERGYFKKNWEAVIEIYVALCFSIILLCYRRFSKKAFLFSIVGAIVCFILISSFIIATRSREETIISIPAFLSILFLIAALGYMQTNRHKRISAIFLQWHAALLPFFFFSIISYATERYRDLYVTGETELTMAAKYPVLSWIDHHVYELNVLNLAFSILYIAIVFNAIAKKHYSLPEE
jgi:hypothetical protein